MYGVIIVKRISSHIFMINKVTKFYFIEFQKMTIKSALCRFIYLLCSFVHLINYLIRCF